MAAATILIEVKSSTSLISKNKKADIIKAKNENKEAIRFIPIIKLSLESDRNLFFLIYKLTRANRANEIIKCAVI